VNKKVAMWIILFALGFVLWASFSSIKTGFNKKSLDYYAFSANYKQDQNCEWGKKAAVYNDHIYYSDTSNGGIFCMNLDGSQCHLVVKSPDIRKIQLSAEGIHYLGFITTVGEENNRYRSFRLFFYDWITEKTLNLMETSLYTSFRGEDLELWDFYITSQGSIVNMMIGEDARVGMPYPSLYCTSTRGAILSNSLSLLRKDNAPIPGSSYPMHCEVAAYDQLLLSAESILESLNTYFFTWGSFSVADRQRNQLAMNTDLLSRLFGEKPTHRTIDGFLLGGVLVHIANEMMLLTPDFQDSVRSVLLDEEKFIRFVFVNGDKAYIITENGEWGKLQSVYEMDLETFTYKKLYTCAKAEKYFIFTTQEEEQILWLDGEKLVTVRGKDVRIWVLRDGEYQLNRTLETAQKIVVTTNKTDVAGDWLFVYRFNMEKNRDELIEMLNIAIS